MNDNSAYLIVIQYGEGNTVTYNLCKDCLKINKWFWKYVDLFKKNYSLNAYKWILISSKLNYYLNIQWFIFAVVCLLNDYTLKEETVLLLNIFMCFRRIYLFRESIKFFQTEPYLYFVP